MRWEIYGRDLEDSLRDLLGRVDRGGYRAKPETFDFLGFKHIYAVPGNADAMIAFYDQVTRHWHKSRKKRSQRPNLPWTRMRRIAERWLPPVQRMHPFPNARFDANTQGRSPVR